VAVHRLPATPLRDWVSAYYGFREEVEEPVRRREGPGHDVVVLISFGDEWSIDGERLTSFAAGLHPRQVTTEHSGRSCGIHVDLHPPTAYSLFRLPLHELAGRAAPLEEVLDESHLVERLHDAGGWDARFALLDDVLQRRLGAAPPPCDGVLFAWRRLRETGGRVRIAALAAELGWSRKRIVARFREQVGLPPKTVARIMRFERARSLVEQAQAPDWTRIALECGYYDQSHLINDFREVTGRTPETFFQDTGARGA
jgi:AraC-like DNA-binding protein